jgi:cytochrome b pre-mRNA-processing protein 3
MSGMQQAGPLGSWWTRRRAAADLRRARQGRAAALYRALVSRARAADLYRDLGVPDTPDGRFELLAMHVALAMRRLGRLGPEGARATQALAELMVRDMDRSVRELGVGDLSVGRYVRRMAASLYARLQVFEAAVPARDLSAVALMLRRNLFTPATCPEPARLEVLARRLLAFADELERVPAEPLLTGELSVPPEAAAEGRGAAGG